MVMEQDKARIASFIFVPSLRGRRWWMTSGNGKKLPPVLWRASPPSPPCTHLTSYVQDSKGMKGLFAGFFPSVLASSVSRVYISSCKAKQRYFRNREERLSRRLRLASAAEAGALVSICTNPIWLIRTRLELQNPLHQSRPYSGVYELRRIMVDYEERKKKPKGASNLL
ncbi:hypothetical protein Goari_019040, partial [Gossypium aridum]|nr:hypothetical protein [Gossypium aridum]